MTFRSGERWRAARGRCETRGVAAVLVPVVDRYEYAGIRRKLRSRCVDARQDLTERAVQLAELGLKRAVPRLLVLRRIRFVRVPGCVRERRLLREEQQQGIAAVNEQASGHGSEWRTVGEGR